MKRAVLTAIFFLAMLLIASAASGADLWIHVTVDETSHARPEHVTVNIPFSVVERVAPLVPPRVLREAKIEMGRTDWDGDEFHAIVDEVRRGRDGDIVRVRDDETTVHARKEGDLFILEVSEETRDEHTVVQIPLGVIDALANGETLDLEAMINALARRGEGEILIARENDSQVRIWIDRNPEGRTR